MENKKMPSFKSGNILIKLADTEKEYEQMWKLRYFELILDYNSNQVSSEEADKDAYDEICDHLIAIDILKDEVIGTYRLIKKSQLGNLGKFLTESEFNIEALYPYEILEVGRAVVKKEYRDGAVINLLWKGVIRYATYEKIDYMIGTASFHGVDASLYQDTLSYLHKNYLSPLNIRCFANPSSCVKIDPSSKYDEDLAWKKMPPLVKGYLRLGATIGEGVYIDNSFNSLDVLIVLKVQAINPRYLKRYLE